VRSLPDRLGTIVRDATNLREGEVVAIVWTRSDRRRFIRGRPPVESVVVRFGNQERNYEDPAALIDTGRFVVVAPRGVRRAKKVRPRPPR
jgi:hypothetical protein